MYRNYLFIFLALNFLFLINTCVGQTLIDQSNSITQIEHDNNYKCTAFCFKEDNEYYYLLSAGHCIEAIKVEFDEVPKLDLVLRHDVARVKYQDVVEVVAWEFIPVPNIKDISILKVKKEDLGQYRPLTVSNLADTNDVNQQDIVWTYGSPMGGYPTAFKAVVLNRNFQSRGIMFYPAAQRGRSGSPLYNSDMSKVIGIISYTNAKDIVTLKDATSSVAIPISEIRKFLEEKGFIDG